MPEADFVRLIDERLGKSDPDYSVPWGEAPVPEWALSFRPQEIWDIGSGLGAFTEAVVLRLGSWGCLENLRKLVMVEADTSLDPGGARGLKCNLQARLGGVLDSLGHHNTCVEVITERITFDGYSKKQASHAPILRRLSGRMADLVIASHITYYFGDGSGRELIDQLHGNHIEPGGVLWCVIRNLECPIYQARRELLSRLQTQDVKPYDYAEYFRDEVLPEVRKIKIRAMREHGYFIKGAHCRDTCHALMWREMADIDDTVYARAVSATCSEEDPLFRETHFILV